jgi:hypothetical protein
MSIELVARQGAPALDLVAAPALPLDARVRSVSVNGAAAKHTVHRSGDVQRVEVVARGASTRSQIVFDYAEGTDVYAPAEPSEPASRSIGLRILRSRADGQALHLLLEGRAGQTYVLHVRTPRTLVGGQAFTVKKSSDGSWELHVPFEGATDGYVRRELSLSLR